MARKKKEETPAPGSPAWMATFSDLMNLLLCFFVLLFSMSSVDEGKAEALVQSLASTFSIFEGGGSSFGDGNMISNGANQLTELDDYFSTMGQTDDGEFQPNINEDDSNGESEGGEVNDPRVTLTPVPDLTATPTPELTATPTPEPTKTPDELIYEENKGQSLVIYDEVMELTGKYNLGDYVEIGVDAENYKYITIEIKGSVLFASGDAALMDEAKPIVSRIGDILKQYKGYRVEVIGHCDSVPQEKAPYYNNDILSAWRAYSVALYLAEDKNLGWDNVYFSGRGEWEPVASNDTKAGRAKNRRVEIRLYNLKNSDD